MVLSGTHRSTRGYSHGTHRGTHGGTLGYSQGYSRARAPLRSTPPAPPPLRSPARCRRRRRRYRRPPPPAEAARQAGVGRARRFDGFRASLSFVCLCVCFCWSCLSVCLSRSFACVRLRSMCWFVRCSGEAGRSRSACVCETTRKARMTSNAEDMPKTCAIDIARTQLVCAPA